jgi:hypothetical protein
MESIIKGPARFHLAFFHLAFFHLAFFLPCPPSTKRKSKAAYRFQLVFGGLSVETACLGHWCTSPPALFMDFEVLNPHHHHHSRIDLH